MYRNTYYLSMQATPTIKPDIFLCCIKCSLSKTIPPSPSRSQKPLQEDQMTCGCSSSTFWEDIII